MQPNSAIILAIDPGKRSGWCLSDSGARIRSGHAAAIGELRDVVVSAIGHAEAQPAPLVIVAERWSQHGRWTAAAQAGTSAQWGRWLAVIEEAKAAFVIPRIGRMDLIRPIVRVDSNVWYRALGGSTRDKREERLAYAMRRSGTDDPDEACARCIAEWATFAPEVDAVLPRAFRRSS